MVLDRFRAPAWRTAIATAGGYLLLLAALTAIFFLIPTLVFGVL